MSQFVVWDRIWPWYPDY